MTSHKHSHDTGRRPLRLRPLPRPSRPDSSDERSAAAPASDDGAPVPADDEPQTVIDDGDDLDGDDDDHARGEWIHEWDRPEA